MRKLQGRLATVKSLSSSEKQGMFELLFSYFNNVERKNFEQDLAEKSWVILLESCDEGKIQGFSTISLLDVAVEGIKVKAVFSGDTIIDQFYWGELELPRLWLDLVFSWVDQCSEVKWYWYLISKGYKTYRFSCLFL